MTTPNLKNSRVSLESTKVILGQKCQSTSPVYQSSAVYQSTSPVQWLNYLITVQSVLTLCKV